MKNKYISKFGVILSALVLVSSASVAAATNYSDVENGANKYKAFKNYYEKSKKLEQKKKELENLKKQKEESNKSDKVDKKVKAAGIKTGAQC